MAKPKVKVTAPSLRVKIDTNDFVELLRKRLPKAYAPRHSLDAVELVWDEEGCWVQLNWEEAE